MSTPEAFSQAPDIRYLDSLKDYRGKVSKFGYILSLDKKTQFADFMEGIRSYKETDYAGLHVLDPNWHEEGKYTMGALHPRLYEKLEEYFRERGLLNNDQELSARCYHTQLKGGSFALDGRPELMIEVNGGVRHDWGQFICVMLDEGFEPFIFDKDKKTIDALGELAKNTGKKEISSDEARKNYLARQKSLEEENRQ